MTALGAVADCGGSAVFPPSPPQSRGRGGKDGAMTAPTTLRAVPSLAPAQAAAEAVVRRGDALHTRAVLVPELAEVARQPAGRAVQHVHRPGLRGRADALARHGDGEV